MNTLFCLRCYILPLLLVTSVLCFGQTSRPPSAKTLQLFNADLKSLKNILQLPGMCVGVVKDGELIYAHADGYANIEKNIPLTTGHMFQIASVTKTFTANLLMQYEQERVANVEDFALNYRFIDTRFGYPYNIDANTKIRHFLSHTSEDGPGRSFVYNGQRFNFPYGVFEKVGGYSQTEDAYSSEVEKRILKPLGMTHSITGFPDSRTDTLFRHIATPYIFDSLSRKFVEDTFNYKWTRAYPATGIISTIGDLAKYTASYDKTRLIADSNYQKITTPTQLTDGSISPYGIGWFTEEFAGKKIHWHYGHAVSYAALFVRLPETGYTFIFLSNSNAPSEGLRLGAGHIWQSPFVTTFLKHFIFPKDKSALSLLQTEDSIGRALVLGYAEQTYGTHIGESKKMIQQLAAAHPERFDVYEPALIHLLTSWRDPEIASLTDRLAHAYDRYRHIQPYSVMDLGQYYEAMGGDAQALGYFKQLADTKGFETWSESVEACRKTGSLLMKAGRIAEGRAYYWKAVNDMRMNSQSDEAIRRMIAEMNRLTQNK